MDQDLWSKSGSPELAIEKPCVDEVQVPYRAKRLKHTEIQNYSQRANPLPATQLRQVGPQLPLWSPFSATSAVTTFFPHQDNPCSNKTELIQKSTEGHTQCDFFMHSIYA